MNTMVITDLAALPSERASFPHGGAMWYGDALGTDERPGFVGLIIFVLDQRHGWEGF